MNRKRSTLKADMPVQAYAGSQPENKKVASSSPASYAGTTCVITCHNYGRFLAQCIESCLAQSRPFENVIVVDDSSDDDTAAIARSFQSCGVSYVRGEWKNYGAARMAGLAAAPRTPFLLFVDADNFLPPDYHERLQGGMTSSDIAAVYGHLLRFNETGPLGLSESIRPFDAEALRSRNFADACSLVRREAFDQAGGWKREGFLTDWMLWLDLTRLGWRMEHVPEAVLHYRVHASQMSNVRYGNWDIHVTPLRQSCLIAIVTLFSGRRWSLDRYFAWLASLDWERGNLHVVAIDNSNDPEFSRELKMRLVDCGLTFTYASDSSQALDAVGAADFAGSRQHRSSNAYTLASHLARLYSVARQHVPGRADFVWSVEDDIEPPPDALHHLCKGLFKYPKAAAVSGCARSRFEDQWILWRKSAPLKEPPPAGEYLPVDATGFYCLLIRRAVFDGIAFRPTRDWSLKNCAYDWAAMHDIVQSGRQVLAAGSVRCAHWQADGTAL